MVDPRMDHARRSPQTTVAVCRFLRIVLYDFEFIGLLLRRVYFAID
jgi:hypothetical protein